MKIHKLIEPKNVYLDLPASDVESALRAVSEVFAPTLGLDPGEVVEALLEREHLGSTSIGGGFAIPHAKIDGLRRIAIAVARFQEAVPFGGDNGDEVGVAFVVLSPPDQPAAHLQVLSQIARVLKRGDLRSGLMEVDGSEALTGAICQAAESEGL
jgi:mannitol/fructose-specific phosphotransferase system IIA component (Ntr-type)